MSETAAIVPGFLVGVSTTLGLVTLVMLALLLHEAIG